MKRSGVGVSLSVLLWLVTGCGDDDDGARRAATATATEVASATQPPPTATRTATSTGSAVPTGTATALVTASPTPTTTCACIVTETPSPSPTATGSTPPEITYFGVARADDLPFEPVGVDSAGRPIFLRIQGSGMTLVLEARPGRRPLNENAYDVGGSTRGVEFLVSRPLGNGSPEVCDILPPTIGGVPATNPPLFSDAPAVNDAIDDLGCRVNDGTGAPRGRNDFNACTRTPVTSEYGFVDARSDLQFCLPVAGPWRFPLGDTIVAARVRDSAGTVSAAREIVVRVQPGEPFGCNEPDTLGERVFTLARPASRLISSASEGDASVDPWLPGTLRICAGPDLGDGQYPLALREDAVLGLALVDGTTLCARLLARGSSGSLDCNGGGAADVATMQTEGGATRVTVDTGLGVDAGTGAAVLRAPIAFRLLPAGTPPSACRTTGYPSQQFLAALTTATGTARVEALAGGTVAEVSATGMPFDCATWRDGGGAALVLPFPVVNSTAGDLAAALILSE